jgi:hypothetical protein
MIEQPHSYRAGDSVPHAWRISALVVAPATAFKLIIPSAQKLSENGSNSIISHTFGSNLKKLMTI